MKKKCYLEGTTKKAMIQGTKISEKSEPQRIKTEILHHVFLLGIYQFLSQGDRRSVMVQEVKKPRTKE